MSPIGLPPELLAEVARRFKALADPARLSIVAALHGSERTVGELVAVTGLSQTNVSKHLRQLHDAGFVVRRKNGLYVHYRLSDDQASLLCGIVGGRLQQELENRRRVSTVR